MPYFGTGIKGIWGQDESGRRIDWRYKLQAGMGALSENLLVDSG